MLEMEDLLFQPAAMHRICLPLEAGFTWWLRFSHFVSSTIWNQCSRSKNYSVGGDQAAANFTDSLYSLKQHFSNHELFDTHPFCNITWLLDTMQSLYAPSQARATAAKSSFKCILLNKQWLWVKVVQSKIIRRLHGNQRSASCLSRGKEHIPFPVQSRGPQRVSYSDSLIPAVNKPKRDFSNRAGHTNAHTIHSFS